MRVRVDKLFSLLGYCSRRSASEFLFRNDVTLVSEPTKRILKAGQIVDSKQILLNDEPLPYPNLMSLVLHKPANMLCHLSSELVYEDDEAAADAYEPETEEYARSVFGLFPRTFAYRTPYLDPILDLPFGVSGLTVFSQLEEIRAKALSVRRPLKRVYEVQFNTRFSGLEQEALTLYRTSTRSNIISIPPVFEVIDEQQKLARISLQDHLADNIITMLTTIRHEPKQIQRIGIGNLTLDNLPEGKWRELSLDDYDLLFQDRPLISRPKHPKITPEPLNQSDFPSLDDPEQNKLEEELLIELGGTPEIDKDQQSRDEFSEQLKKMQKEFNTQREQEALSMLRQRLSGNIDPNAVAGDEEEQSAAAASTKKATKKKKKQLKKHSDFAGEEEDAEDTETTIDFGKMAKQARQRLREYQLSGNPKTGPSTVFDDEDDVAPATGKRIVSGHSILADLRRRQQDPDYMLMKALKPADFMRKMKSMKLHKEKKKLLANQEAEILQGKAASKPD